MTVTTELDPSEFRDPGKTIDEVAVRNPLRAGDVRVALVRHPSTMQDLIAVVDLPECEWVDLDDWELSRYLQEKVDPLPVPDFDGNGPSHATMTIIARRGFTVFGPGEARWLLGWHFCHHLKHMYTSGFVVVTEHGWADFMTGRGAHVPALPVEA